MNKKIMLLALGAISAVLLALPAMASALVPLHLNPAPAKFVIDSTSAPELTSGGGVIKCGSVSGTGTFQAGGTTGEMTLTFGPHCPGPFGETCTNNAVNNHITTTPLPFHLVTVEHPAGGGGKSPGVLVTPGAGGFAHFTCHTFLGTLDQTVEGNGVIGTITNPLCNGSSSEPTIQFAQASTGNQTHTRVVGTATVYSLKKGGETMALNATAKLTPQDATGKAVISKLECT